MKMTHSTQEILIKAKFVYKMKFITIVNAILHCLDLFIVHCWKIEFISKVRKKRRKIEEQTNQSTIIVNTVTWRYFIYISYLFSIFFFFFWSQRLFSSASDEYFITLEWKSFAFYHVWHRIGKLKMQLIVWNSQKAWTICVILR